jgi:hypothetical protein
VPAVLTNYGLSLVSDQDEMLTWLARAARELREAKGRKLVHVAASWGKSESSVWRFESATGWPERPDGLIAAYADDLDMDPREIWATALRLWDASTQPGAEKGGIPGPRDGFPRPPADHSTTDGTPEQQESRVARGARRRTAA